MKLKQWVVSTLWPWLRKRLPKQISFFCHLLFCSCLFHLLFLIGGFIIYRGDYATLNFLINKKTPYVGAQIVFLPLYKIAPKKVTLQTAVDVTNQPVALKKKAQKEIKQLHQKTTIKTNTKKIEEPKKAVKKKPTKPKKGIKKSDENKQLVKEVQNSKVPSVQKTKNRNKQKHQDANKTFIGRRELTGLRMQQYIQKKVVSCWRPPMGLSDTIECQIKFLIDRLGNIKNIHIQKPSGIIAYDLSCQSALVQVKQLPKWACTKEFCVTFKQ